MTAWRRNLEHHQNQCVAKVKQSLLCVEDSMGADLCVFWSCCHSASQVIIHLPDTCSPLAVCHIMPQSILGQASLKCNDCPQSKALPLEYQTGGKFRQGNFHATAAKVSVNPHNLSQTVAVGNIPWTQRLSCAVVLLFECRWTLRWILVWPEAGRVRKAESFCSRSLKMSHATDLQDSSVCTHKCNFPCYLCA